MADHEDNPLLKKGENVDASMMRVLSFDPMRRAVATKSDVGFGRV